MKSDRAGQYAAGKTVRTQVANNPESTAGKPPVPMPGFPESLKLGIMAVELIVGGSSQPLSVLEIAERMPLEGYSAPSGEVREVLDLLERLGLVSCENERWELVMKEEKPDPMESIAEAEKVGMEMSVLAELVQRSFRSFSADGTLPPAEMDHFELGLMYLNQRLRKAQEKTSRALHDSLAAA